MQAKMFTLMAVCMLPLLGATGLWSATAAAQPRGIPPAQTGERPGGRSALLSPSPCNLLQSPQRQMLSATAELALMRRCGEPLPQLAQRFAAIARPQGLQTAAPGVSENGPVNDPADDTFPNQTTQSETTIAKDPVTGHLIVGWNDSGDFTGAPGDSFTGWGVSMDGGLTWTDMGPFPPLTPDDWSLGDPSLAAHHATGAVYMATLACAAATCNVEKLEVAKSTDGGLTWPQRVNPVVPPTFPLIDGSGVWQAASLNINAALGSANVVIRFTFDTVDNFFNAFEGFHVDDVTVMVDAAPIFMDDFESGAPGWTNTGLWHLTMACSAPLPGHSTPTTFYYGQDATCNYDTGANAGTLVSPTIDLSGPGTTATLNFNYVLQTEGGPCFFDKARVQLSTDGGATFTDVASSCQSIWDKELIAVDNTGGACDGNVYLAATDFSDGHIKSVRSTDGGVSWSPPTVLDPGPAFCNTGAFPAVGPAGEIYVAWENFCSPGIEIVKSTNCGVTWSAPTVISPITPVNDPVAQIACGRRALNGQIRITDFPAITVNPTNGHVYVTFNADPDGAGVGDASDVFFSRSTDGGTTWSPRLRVNDDSTSRDQFMPAMDVANDGTVMVSWYDRREDPGNLNIRRWGATSTDGGLTFTNVSLGTAQFPPMVNFDPQVGVCYMGDYDWITHDENNFYLVWADNRNMVGPPHTPRNDPDIFFAKVSLSAPPACVEDTSGALDVVGIFVAPGETDAVPIEVNNAPNEVRALGFEVAFDATKLTYAGFTTLGTLTQNFDFFDVSNPAPGVVRIGGVEAGPNPIAAGSSGTLVLLNFTVHPSVPPQETIPLHLQDLVDDLGTWSASDGCLTTGCPHDGDVNVDGRRTPADALLAFQFFLDQIVLDECEADHADVLAPVDPGSDVTPADALCIFNKFLDLPSCLDTLAPVAAR